MRVPGCGIVGENCLRAKVGASIPLLMPLLERFTGSQIEWLSGLSGLERSQELRDLTARGWMALGDHGGGRIGFSWKMKGAFGFEKGRGRAFWSKRGDGTKLPQHNSTANHVRAC
jgi:hypothetical protein